MGIDGNYGFNMSNPWMMQQNTLNPFGLTMDGTTPTTTSSTTSTTDADLKEYKKLLDKQSKGTLTTVEQSRLKTLQSSLSSAGKLNRDGSVRTKSNSDKLKANARKMSWDEVANIWGLKRGSATSGASKIVQNTAAHATFHNGSGMMSKNGSLFGQRRV